MNLQKGDLAMVCGPHSPMVKPTQDEEEEVENFSHLELSYLHLVGDLPDL